MNIEQLEKMLTTTNILWEIIDDGPLGLEGIKEKLDELETAINEQLMILVYEKYTKEKEAGD